MKTLSLTSPLSNVIEGECRLDATYYASSVYQAKEILDKAKKEKGFHIKKISDFSEKTFNPPPIKRIFSNDYLNSTPYMLPQEMFDFYWEPKKYVLAEKMDDIQDWFMKENWIILTQSGTVGKPYFATSKDENIVLSQNAIRVKPLNEEIAGYIYAYLSTWVGQTLLKKDEFGITVKHIRPHHVDDIPIPDIGYEKELEISNKIKKAFELRNKAIDLINDAKKEIYEALDCPSSNIFDSEESHEKE